MAVMLLEAPRGKNPAYLVMVTWPSAWIVHLIMSAAWILDTRLPRIFVLAGLIVGFLGVLAMPIHFLISPMTGKETLGLVVQLFAIELLVIAPALGLAFVTSKFHWNTDETAPAENT